MHLRRATTRGYASLAGAVRRAADASRPALLAPQQDIAWSYEELDTRVRSLARGLREHGFGKGSVAVSDLGNIAENLLLQLALSHCGATVATAKDDEALAKLIANHDVRGAVVTSAASPLAEAKLRWPPVVLQPEQYYVPFHELASAPPFTEDAACTEDGVLGVYGGAALTHGAAHALGAAAARALDASAADTSCVSITLFHAFGMGSAVGCALHSGGAVVLPAVGGIRGCGDPKQRAEVTRDVLGSTSSTLLFADSHTLKGLHGLPLPAAGLPSLRGGVCKIGSGSDFLPDATSTGGAGAVDLEYAGVKLSGMGKL